MAEILGAATTATKYFLEVNQVTIDNATFKLFYKATTTLLLACSLVTSSKQFFGDPINCEVVRPSLYSFYASGHFGPFYFLFPNFLSSFLNSKLLTLHLLLCALSTLHYSYVR